jgi:hypothetical protein
MSWSTASGAPVIMADGPSIGMADLDLRGVVEPFRDD